MAEQIAGVGHWRLGIQKNTLEWSAEVFRIHGLDPDAPLPSRGLALSACHQEDRERVARIVDHAMRTNTGYTAPWRLVRPDGEIRHVLARGMPEHNAAGEVTALFGVLMDVTEERIAEHTAQSAQAELHAVTQHAREAAEASNESLQRLARHLERALGRAEQGSQAKSRFLAGMSHELRTPLNGILGYAQLLRMDGGLNELQLGRVASMLDAGQHLLDMINRVLDLSEVEVGRMELQRASIDLHATASLCLDFVRPAAGERGLALILDCAPGLPATMIGDSTRLRQVLLNLLGNAVKFTPTGTVTLHLAPASAATRLRVEVADTGPGIPAGSRHRLFQDFDRLDNAAAAHAEGAGLGLSISAQIAAAMGGAIGYMDNSGGGSIFWLEVPLGEKPQLRLHAPPPAPAPSALRVLVVDDVEMNRTIAAGFLQAAGHTPTCVDGGPAALAAIAAHPFDLVFMDVRMPGMDGLETTIEIRRTPAGHAIPIVAVTAQAFTEQIEACRQSGMDGHLSKPFTPQTMQAAIGESIAAAARRAGPPAPLTPPSEPESPIFDQAALDRIAAFMPRDTIAAHLATLSSQCAALRRGLARAAPPDARLIDDAHALAGSAGLFGFLRLSQSARAFEHAARGAAPTLPTTALIEQIDSATLSISNLMPDRVAA